MKTVSFLPLPMLSVLALKGQDVKSNLSKHSINFILTTFHLNEDLKAFGFNNIVIKKTDSAQSPYL